MSDAQNLTGMVDSNDSGAGGYVDADLRDVINDALAEDEKTSEEQKLAQAYRKYYDDRTLEDWRMMFFDMQTKMHANDVEWRDMKRDSVKMARQIKIYMEHLDSIRQRVNSFNFVLNTCLAAAHGKAMYQVLSIIKEAFIEIGSIWYSPKSDVWDIVQDLLNKNDEIPF